MRRCLRHVQPMTTLRVQPRSMAASSALARSAGPAWVLRSRVAVPVVRHFAAAPAEPVQGSERLASASLFDELSDFEGEDREAVWAEVTDPLEPRVVTAKSLTLKSSPKRMYRILQPLTGRSYTHAKAILVSQPWRGSPFALKVLEAARLQAMQRWNVESDDELVVTEAWVGKAQYLKRIRFHAKGKSGRMLRRRVHVFIRMRHWPKEARDALNERIHHSLAKRGVPTASFKAFAKRAPRRELTRVAKEVGAPSRRSVRDHLCSLVSTGAPWYQPKLPKSAVEKAQQRKAERRAQWPEYTRMLEAQGYKVIPDCPF